MALMENTPWRIVIIAAGASLILLVSIFLITLPKKAGFDTENIEKILEFKNAFFAGHEEGKKVWEFYAREGWSGRSSTLTYLTDISRGRLFKKNGELIVKDLKGLKVKAYRATKIVEVWGVPEEKPEGASKLTALIAFAKNNKKYKFANLKADYLRYDPNAKRSDVKGHIVIVNPSFTLLGENMTIDHDKGTSTLSEKILYRRKDLKLKCGNVEYDSNDERVVASVSVESSIKSSPHPTYLKAQKLILFADEKKDIFIQGEVDLHQGKKYAVADSAVYSNPGQKILLTGQVKAVFQKGDALLRKDTMDKLKNPDARKLLKEKTFLTADNLEVKTKSGDARAFGRVYIYQKGREARSQTAEYNDKLEDILMTGDVHIKKENQWIKCQRIVVSVDDETFTAVGSVEAEFKIKK
jgi:lipopolysaccharide assembly outer membrane protein LptD (OstA)